jgi:hypothetical protein
MAVVLSEASIVDADARFSTQTSSDVKETVLSARDFVFFENVLQALNRWIHKNDRLFKEFVDNLCKCTNRCSWRIVVAYNRLGTHVGMHICWLKAASQLFKRAHHRLIFFTRTARLRTLLCDHG